MNAARKLSKIENWDFRIALYAAQVCYANMWRSASLLREYVTPTQTPTSRAGISGICMSKPSIVALIVSEISPSIVAPIVSEISDGQTVDPSSYSFRDLIVHPDGQTDGQTVRLALIVSEISYLNSLAPIVSEVSAFIPRRGQTDISAFIRTDGQADVARSTWLVILINIIYTLWGRKRFRLPVTYFSETLPSACYILSKESRIPFYSTSNGYNKTFYSTSNGYNKEGPIVEYPDYQIPVT